MLLLHLLLCTYLFQIGDTRALSRKHSLADDPPSTIIPCPGNCVECGGWNCTTNLLNCLGDGMNNECSSSQEQCQSNGTVQGVDFTFEWHGYGQRCRYSVGKSYDCAYTAGTPEQPYQCMSEMNINIGALQCGTDFECTDCQRDYNLNDTGNCECEAESCGAIHPGCDDKPLPPIWKGKTCQILSDECAASSQSSDCYCPYGDVQQNCCVCDNSDSCKDYPLPPTWVGYTCASLSAKCIDDGNAPDCYCKYDDIQMACCTCSGGTDNCYEYGVAYLGNDLSDDVPCDSAYECQGICQETADCQYWTFATNTTKCWVKSSDAGATSKTNRISGPKYCSQSCEDEALSQMWNGLTCPDLSSSCQDQSLGDDCYCAYADVKSSCCVCKDSFTK